MENFETQVWIYNQQKERLLVTNLIKTTEKAFCIKCNNDGYNVNVIKEENIWIPKSICEIKEDSKLLKLTIPNWWINKNKL